MQSTPSPQSCPAAPLMERSANIRKVEKEKVNMGIMGEKIEKGRL